MNNLIKYLQQHGIKVLSNTADSIIVESVYNDNGKPGIEIEALPADFKTIRIWLGY